MIPTEFRWQNFRPFVDTGWIKIKPITILIGPNNSGKSSFLAPLLIMKQTLTSLHRGSPLVLRGGLIDAGAFSDIVYNHNLDENIIFSMRFFDRPSSESAPDLGEDPPSQCSVTFKAVGKEGEFALHNYEIADSYGRIMISRTRGDGRAPIRYSLDKLSEWAFEEEGEEDVIRSNANKAAIAAINNDRPFHFLFNYRDIFRRVLNPPVETESSGRSSGHSEQLWVGEGPSSLSLSSSVALYLSAVSRIEHYVREHALDIVFLGPLREDPKRLYELSGDTPSDVGIRGEFGPELLRLNQRRSVFKEVNRWLQAFGLNGSLLPKRVTDTAFTLVVQSEGTSTNFADVGFGFSQLLPLVVQGLMGSSSDTLLIAEQPEIHLNPRLQAKLADLFQEITRRDAAVLVETHSEHLLLAIRRLVAEGSLQSKNVAIYFVETGDSGSQIRSVPLHENGHIEPSDWPQGFFGDALRESLRLANAQARRRDAD